MVGPVGEGGGDWGGCEPRIEVNVKMPKKNRGGVVAVVSGRAGVWWGWI